MQTTLQAFSQGNTIITYHYIIAHADIIKLNGDIGSRSNESG